MNKAVTDHDLETLASAYVDEYLDMGCFKDPSLFRPALIEGFLFGFRAAENYHKHKYYPFGQEPVGEDDDI